MEPAETRRSGFSIGEVLSEAWSLYTRFFTRFIVIAAIVYAVLGLVEAIVNSASDDGWLSVLVWAVISIVISLVGYFWLQGTLVEAVRDVRDGRADESVGELFAKVRPRLPALIVPGLFLLTRWILIVPVIVLEGRSAGEAFSRSWELVKGSSWSVFGLILVTLVGLAIVGGIVTAIVGAVLGVLGTFLGTWLTSIVVNSLIAPFVALSWTVAYYRLTGGGPAVPAAADATP